MQWYMPEYISAIEKHTIFKQWWECNLSTGTMCILKQYFHNYLPSNFHQPPPKNHQHGIQECLRIIINLKHRQQMFINVTDAVKTLWTNIGNIRIILLLNMYR